jgi:two-component system, cell cycle sensor histidine kinase and response regulator CckA
MASRRGAAPQPGGVADTQREYEMAVLIVDDEPSVLTITARLVERLGYQALTAESGAEALDRLRGGQESIDCVLIDLTMPDMTGDRVIATLRAIAPDLPVVLMSGYSAEEMALRVGASQATSFLQKPFSSEMLRATLARCLGQTKQ